MNREQSKHQILREIDCLRINGKYVLEPGVMEAAIDTAFTAGMLSVRETNVKEIEARMKPLEAVVG